MESNYMNFNDFRLLSVTEKEYQSQKQFLWKIYIFSLFLYNIPQYKFK